ncbi:hypothetical protein [Kineobactrum sediminis]|uniref:hypothetical protein n=1 Tax=Kineobactrum sediminis TaxID=1905677 RepID=UPI0012D7B594|nr:hypothetical protein [Kineobactrum sediminis]
MLSTAFIVPNQESHNSRLADKDITLFFSRLGNQGSTGQQLPGSTPFFYISSLASFVS